MRCCTCCRQLLHCPLSLPTPPHHPGRRPQPLTAHWSAPLTPRTGTDCGTDMLPFERWLRAAKGLRAMRFLHVLQTASPLPSLAAYSPTPPQTKATAIDCSQDALVTPRTCTDCGTDMLPSRDGYAHAAKGLRAMRSARAADSFPTALSRCLQPHTTPDEGHSH